MHISNCFAFPFSGTNGYLPLFYPWPSLKSLKYFIWILQTI
jgi:hypothetical protein